MLNPTRAATVCLFATLLYVRSCAPPIRNHYSVTQAGPPSAESGELLYHRIGAGKVKDLPLLALAGSWLNSHPGGLPGSPKLWVAIELLLFIAAGTLLYCAAGAIASLSMLLVCLAHTPAYASVQPGYSLLVLLTSAVLIWRAEDPTWARSLLLALSIGATFLFRSPLAFLPPALALFELFAWHRGSLRSAWRGLVLLCLVPYLFLVPWIRLNWILQHQFIPFENGEAEQNIIAGALGAVIGTDDLRIAEAPWGYLVDGKADAGKGTALLVWASLEVSRHPLRYAVAIARRLWYILGFHPLLFLASVLAVWVHRKRKGFQELGLLCLYFLLVHCTMPVLERYFAPLWPLLALLAGALFAALLTPAAEEAAQWRRRASAGVVGAALAVVVAASLFAERLVLAYAGAASKGDLAQDRLPSALERELLRYPNDVFLLSLRAQQRLDCGEFAGAVEDWDRPCALHPMESSYQGPRAWALALLGRPQALLSLKPDRSESLVGRTNYTLEIRQATILLALGKKEDARRLLSHALQSYLATFVKSVDQAILVLPDGAGREDRQPAEAWLARGKTEFLKIATRAIEGAPLPQTAALLEELARLLPPAGEVWLMQAQAALARGESAHAVDFLARAAGQELSQPQLRQLLQLSRQTGGDAVSLAATKRLLESRLRRPQPWIQLATLQLELKDDKAANVLLTRATALKLSQQDSRSLAALWIELAGLQVALGDRKAALASLARVAELKPSPGDLRSLVLACRRVGADDVARAALKNLTALDSRDAPQLIELARLKLKANDRQAALGLLAGAATAKPSQQDLRFVAIAYQSLGMDRAARAVLKKLVGLDSSDAALWIQLARLDLKANDRQAALGSLAKAAATKPAQQDLRSLASIYQSLGMNGEARTVIEKLVGLDPTDAARWAQLARLELKANDRQAALASLAKAATLKPSRQDLLFLAAAYSSLGKDGEAAAATEKLLAQNSKDAGLWIESARLKVRRGDRAGAISALGRAQALGLSTAQARSTALVYQDLKLYQLSSDLLAAQVGHNPGDAELLGDLGVSEQLAGSSASAIAHLNAAIRIKPRGLNFYLTLASIYLGGNDLDNARRTYDHAEAACREEGARNPLWKVLIQERKQLEAGAHGTPKAIATDR